ncbi:hypothetical protein EB796_022069 [Bugula neritina]|uniref:Uncharacterized protein n=1 Tax=Bugula neritina TaxID=10212 RepID=A0A7J7J1I5_BUGNE|nr:hypothetical protein EB796_022069 [Bugula neritina]
MIPGSVSWGSNDSTGGIAACWFGALYGFTGVHEIIIRQVHVAGRCEAIIMAVSGREAWMDSTFIMMHITKHVGGAKTNIASCSRRCMSSFE